MYADMCLTLNIIVKTFIVQSNNLNLNLLFKYNYLARGQVLQHFTVIEAVQKVKKCVSTRNQILSQSQTIFKNTCNSILTDNDAY